MPRQARLDAPGALHHIIRKNKAPIFKDDQDKTRFLERPADNVVQGQCAVHAWVLMTNHVHLLFRSGKDGISSVMRKQLTWNGNITIDDIRGADTCLVSKLRPCEGADGKKNTMPAYWEAAHSSLQFLRRPRIASSGR